MVIFDLAPLSHWRQKRHAAQVAIQQNLAHDRLRLMLIIELQRLQLQWAERQREEMLTMVQQRMEAVRQLAATPYGAHDQTSARGQYIAYSEVKWLIDSQA